MTDFSRVLLFLSRMQPLTNVAPTSHGVGLLLQALGIEEPWLDDFIHSDDVPKQIDFAEELPQFEATKFIDDFPLADG